MIDALQSDRNISQLGTIQLKRGRTSRLNIRVLGDGTVSVKSPHWLPESKVRHFLSERSDWIMRQQKRQDELYGFVDDNLTPTTRIEFKTHHGEDFHIIESEKTFTVFSPEKSNDSNWNRYHRVRNEIIRRLEVEAEVYLPEKVEDLARLHQITYSDIRLKFMKSRWGSCNNRGDLVFNTQLVRLPDRLRHYVVSHELAHTLHMNHGRAFHLLLESIAPGAKTLSRELARYQLLE